MLLGASTLNSSRIATFQTSALALGGHAITVSYSGDSNYASSTSSTLTETVNQDATTTSVTSSLNPAYFGQAVTFTATVSASSPGSGTPTGTVGFSATLAGGTVVQLGTGTLTTQYALPTATYTTSGLQLPPGSVQTITASYLGNANFSTSSGSVLNAQIVNQDPSTTTVTSVSPLSVFGQAVTFTATVVSNGPYTGAPTGTVTFQDGATTLGTGTLSIVSGAIRASYTTSALQLLVGSGQAITAGYSGDVNFVSSTSLPLSHTVAQAQTTTSISSSLHPSSFGQPVTFTAAVTVNFPGSGTPTGTVTFLDGAALLGTSALNTTSSPFTAAYTTSALQLSGGANQLITAVYSGDGNFVTSTSAPVSQTVNKDGTSTSVTTSTPSVDYGQAVTFTAAVNDTGPDSAPPTGTVTFKDGTTTLGTSLLSTTTMGAAQAVYTTSALQLPVGGGQIITASYGGNVDFTGSSSTLSESVNLDATTTTLHLSTSSSSYGQPVTITANVAASAPGSGTPTGTYTFSDNGGFLGWAVLSGGAATITTSYPLSVGIDIITGTYSGNADYQPNSLGSADEAVTMADTTVTLDSSASPAVYGQAVTFFATVTASNSTGVVPAGSVDFYDGATSTDLGSATLDGYGVATLTVPNPNATAFLAPGGLVITATYSGDSDFQTNYGVLDLDVQCATTTTLTSTLDPSGTGLTFTASVAATGTPPPSGTAPLSGTVTFSDGLTSETVPLTGGGTTWDQGPLSTGGHDVTATYNGTDYYAESVSNTIHASTTTTTLDSSVNPSLYGQTVTLTAVVDRDDYAVAPPGDVDFYDNTTSTDLGVETLDGLGSATVSLPNWTLGDHVITATYLGSSPFTSSYAVLDQDVQGSTTTTLASSLDASRAGLIFTATVAATGNPLAPGTPNGGTVTFSDGVVSQPVPVVNGAAQWDWNPLPYGGHFVTATYSGDSDYEGSVSGYVHVSTTTTTLSSSSPNGTIYGQPVAFTANVAADDPTTGVPTGLVDFYNNTTGADLARQPSTPTATRR